MNAILSKNAKLDWKKKTKKIAKKKKNGIQHYYDHNQSYTMQ